MGDLQLANDAASPPEWRLRVWHFLLWTAASAFLFALMRLATVSADDAFHMANLSTIPPYAVAMSLALEGRARRRSLRVPFPVEPGEGLAIVAALQGAEYLVTLMASQLYNVGGTYVDLWLPLLFTGIALVTLMPALLFCIRCSGGRDARAWKPLFRLCAFSLFLALVRQCGAVFPIPGITPVLRHPAVAVGIDAILVALAAWTIVIDRRYVISRRWTHWVGGATWLISTVLNMGLRIWLYVLQTNGS